jgi:hypothetical protein
MNSKYNHHCYQENWFIYTTCQGHILLVNLMVSTDNHYYNTHQASCKRRERLWNKSWYQVLICKESRPLPPHSPSVYLLLSDPHHQATLNPNSKSVILELSSSYPQRRPLPRPCARASPHPHLTRHPGGPGPVPTPRATAPRAPGSPPGAPPAQDAMPWVCCTHKVVIPIESGSGASHEVGLLSSMLRLPHRFRRCSGSWGPFPIGM